MFVLSQLLCQVSPENMQQLTQSIQVKLAFTTKNDNWLSLTECFFAQFRLKKATETEGNIMFEHMNL